MIVAEWNTFTFVFVKLLHSCEINASMKNRIVVNENLGIFFSEITFYSCLIFIIQLFQKKCEQCVNFDVYDFVLLANKNSLRTLFYQFQTKVIREFNERLKKKRSDIVLF